MSDFPPAPADISSGSPQELSRRRAVQLLAANLALVASGCSKPAEKIVPYVTMPEGLVPGETLRFATTLPLAGYGRGVICRSQEGRPIKVDGNPRHPASLGSTDVFCEAAVFSLYDPDRSRAVRQDGVISSWQAFAAALQKRLDLHRAGGGEGLRILTGRVTSPTLLRQLAILRERFPALVHHVYEPTDDPNAERGAVMAFGRPLRMLPRWRNADILVTLDADPLGPGPDQIRNGRGYADRRRVRAATATMLRHYAFESVPTATGVGADHRLALAPDAIAAATIALARALGAELPEPGLSAEAQRVVAAAARDLLDHPGAALVLAGPSQAAEIHALAHWINGRLQAPIDYFDPIDAASPPGTLAELATDLAAGKVTTLLVGGANPIYDAPGDLDFERALHKAEFTAHLGLYWDETARQCQWHLPQSHALESWSDLRATDGTASIVQPLIRPLYETRDLHTLLAAMTGQPDTSAYDLVRETWRGQGDAAAFERAWRQSLNDGLIADSAAAPVTAPPPQLPAMPPPAQPQGFTLLLHPDPSVWDGGFANNAWLQECPKPLSKEVWGNSLGIAPLDAVQFGLREGDVVRLTVGTQQVEAPVRAAPGQAKGVLSLALGHGRTAAGAIGNGIGSNAFRLRRRDAAWRLEGVALATTGGRQPVASTQHQFKLEGEERELFPVTPFGHLGDGIAKGQEPAPRPSLYAKADPGPTQWGMVIDTTACIGCNACVVACQAENNVPVVGPQEVLRERDMHWLRIDTYNTGTSDAPRFGFQPVPCMHCEEAPCEPVCPVAASVHDDEGLNVQVYNRCVGTRFCQANCPYKVRRFNFHGYADGQEYSNLGAEIMRAHNNPDVSVRARGVMEKCTYCVQRISGARRTAEKEGRVVRDGEVTTACQDACPTRAITFGNLASADTAVSGLRKEPHHYALLAHLGTRPKTTYLAQVRNPNPKLAEDEP